MHLRPSTEQADFEALHFKTFLLLQVHFRLGELLHTTFNSHVYAFQHRHIDTPAHHTIHM